MTSTHMIFVFATVQRIQLKSCTTSFDRFYLKMFHAALLFFQNVLNSFLSLMHTYYSKGPKQLRTFQNLFMLAMNRWIFSSNS